MHQKSRNDFILGDDCQLQDTMTINQIADPTNMHNLHIVVLTQAIVC